MRKLLLSMAMAFTATAMQAQSWTAPTLTLTTDAVPDSAYMYHVGQQMFFTKGTTWGTHAALTSDASSAMLYKFEEQSDGAYKLYSDAASNTGYLGRSTYSQLYTDYNSQTAWSIEFSITKVGSYFQIKTSENSDNFGTASDEADGTDYNTYLMGWDPSNDDVNTSGTSLGTNVGIFMIDPTTEGIETDWAFVLVEDQAIYASRTSLYEKLIEAQQLGVSTTSAAAVYSNSSATVDEIDAATAELVQAIADYQQNQASEDNPIDMTEAYLVNADFSAGSLEGWTTVNGVIVYTSEELPNSSCTATEWNQSYSAAWSSSYVSTGNAHAWVSSSTTLGDDSIYQTITDLPAGKYVLTGAFVAQHSTDFPTGVYLFANGITENSMAIQHDETLWEEAVANDQNNQRLIYPELEIVHAGGDLTVGATLQSTNCNYFYALYFQLICKGQTEENAYSLALSQVLAQAQVYEDDYTYVYSLDTYDELENQIANATDLLGNGAEDSEYETATANLKDLIETIKSEVTAYTSLASLIESIQSDIERYSNLEDLTEALENLYDECTAAYEDRNATVDQINTWMDSYDTTITTAVKAAMADATPDNPIEVTALATNMSYDDNTWDGWTLTTGSVGGNSGNVSYGVAEVWYNTFSAMQTLSDMPAGSYKLTAKAFYRTSSTADGYSAYTAASDKTEGILTYLSVAGGTSPVVNQAAGVIEATDAPYTGYTEFETGLWLPNTMQSAAWAFEQDDTYLCSATGYLTADGDLTFGIYNDELTASNAWSIWDDFHLYYCGIDNTALYEQLVAIQNQAISLQDNACMIAEADELLNNAIGAADDVTEDSSEEEMLAVIDQLNEAIEYANTGIDLVYELIDAYDTYSEKVNEVESDDDSFLELIGAIGDAIQAEEFESNEQIQEWIDSLPTAWTAYVQYNALGGTVDSPADITAILVNPSFDTGTNDNTENTGWTREYTTSGGHVGIASTSQQEASDYAAEMWQCTSFNFYQEVVGLAAGYYRVTANAVSRHNTPSETSYEEYLANPDSTSNISLYANTQSVRVPHVYSETRTESTFGTGEESLEYNGTTYYYIRSMQSAYTAFELGLFSNTVDVYLSEGETLKVGLYLHGTGSTGNWCVWDNFKLYYMGNDSAPTGVEGIEAETATASDGKIYDLSGRRVQKAQKGLYIIDGKKVMVK